MCLFMTSLVVLYSILLNGLLNADSSSGCSKDATINQPFQLLCPGVSSSGNYWRFNETRIFADENLLSSVISNVSVNDNYTLIISNCSWNYIGIYECIRNGTSIVKHRVCVTDAPDPETTVGSNVLSTSKTESTTSVETHNTPSITTTIPELMVVASISVASVFIVILIVACLGTIIRMKGSDNRIREIVETELRNFPIIPETAREEIPDIPPRAAASGNTSPGQIRSTLLLLPGEVRLLSKLPGNGLTECWLAVSAVGLRGGDKFIAKSVSDAAKTKDIMSFRQLAKEAHLLTKHPHIVEQIAVAVSDFPYYIYQEYLEGGNLRHFMLRNFEKSNEDFIDNPCSSSAMTPMDAKKLHLLHFALEVVNGMSFLEYNNYRHPGLCLKKVLLTNTMTCKLYDFWPDDLSRERLRTILEKPAPPTAWFPTETIFLQQYSKESDVWSYAVLLWEIFSFGNTPYAGLSVDKIETEIRHGRTLPQPTNCPGGVYGIMLSSWDTVVNNRPSFMQLQEQMQAMLNAFSQEICPLKENELLDEPNYFALGGCSGENDYTETC